jgi:hypothetical protein
MGAFREERAGKVFNGFTSIPDCLQRVSKPVYFTRASALDAPAYQLAVIALRTILLIRK